MRRKFDRGLIAGIGLLTALVLVNGVLSYRNVRQLNVDARQVAHTHEVLDALSGVRADGEGLEARQRTYLVVGDADARRRLDEALRATDETVARVRRLTADNPGQQARVRTLQDRFQAAKAGLTRTADVRQAQGFDAAREVVLTGATRKALDDVAATVDEMAGEERTRLEERLQANERTYTLSVVGALLAAVFGLLAVGAFVRLLERHLRSRDRAAETVHREREVLRTTLGSIGDAVIATDTEGRVTFLNPVANGLTGWSAEDARGKPLEEVFRIVNETTREAVENPALRALKEGVIVGLANHTVLVAKDGAERPIDDSAAPIRGRGAEVTGAVLVFRDVAERRLAEDRLRASEARKAAVLHASLDAIITIDSKGKVVEFNPAAEELFGYAQAEAVGRDMGELIVPDSMRESHRQGMARYLATGVGRVLDRRLEMPARRKDGSEIVVELAITRLAGGDRPLFTGFARDITARRRAEAALAERTRLVALRADVSTALASTDATATALRRCCEALVSHLDVAFARIWTLDEAEQILELRASAGLYTHLDGPHGRVPVGQFKIGRIARTGQPHLTNSVQDDPNVSDPAWARREEMVAFAGYPLAVEGRVVGVAAMFARRPLSEAALTDLSSLAEGMGQYLDRRRAEERVRRQAELLRVTLSSIGDAVLTTDASGRVNFLNGVAQDLTGWSHEAAEGQSVEAVFNIVNEQTGEAVESPVAKVLRDGVVVGLANHTLLIARDGTRRPIDDSGAPIRAGDEMVGVVLVFWDVSERRRAEEERQLLASIVENSPDYIGVADAEGKPVYVNRAGMALVGLDDLAQVRRSALPDYFFPEQWAFLAEVVLPTTQRDGRWSGELTFQHFKTGAAIPVLSAVFRVDDPATGKPINLATVTRDITERKRAEEQLRENERRLRFVMDSMPQKIFTATPDGDVDYFNPQWSRFTGLSFEQIRDWGWTQFIHPDDVAENVRVWKHAVATGEPFQFEHRFRSADGEYRWHLSRAVALTDDGGRVLMWVGSNTDIHEQRQTANELRRLAADLSEADRRKDEFLATLAHELRNPLAPIRNGLQVMRRAGGDSQAVARVRDMMERQLGQMVRLVDDLLDVSRITRGKLELRKEQVELAAVLGSAVETSRPLIEAAGHRFTVTLPPAPVYLDADLTRLAQVVSNLLTNSAKYTERGGRIRLTAERQGDEAVVTVEDTGVGIPADMLPKVFEMFTQVDRSLEKAQGGLGIGLTLVKRLVGMHGGTVEARSEGYGKGSEFVVRLPVAAAVPAEETVRREDAGAGGESVKRRILVVDDNEDSANSLSLLLRLMGSEVRTAHDGLAAVAEAAAFQPDVILLDIGMPKLNGYEACRRIREGPGGKRFVIVACTGWGQDEDRRRSKEAGFDFHMVKPVDAAELEKLLAGVPPRT